MKKYFLAGILIALALVVPSARAAGPSIESLLAQIADLSREISEIQSNTAQIADGTSLFTPSALTTLDATPTDPKTPTAPYTLSGNYSVNSFNRFTNFCFQLRTSTTGYSADCNTPLATAPFTTQGQVSNSSASTVSILFPFSGITNTLSPDTTYVYRAVARLGTSGATPLYGKEVTFKTPPLPTVATPTAPVTAIPVTTNPVPTPIVAGKPSLEFVFPATQTTAQKGTTVTIQWRTKNFGSLKTEIGLLSTTATGTPLLTHIATVDAGVTNFKWTVPYILQGTNFQLILSSVDKGPSAQALRPIKIVNPPLSLSYLLKYVDGITSNPLPLNPGQKGYLFAAFTLDTRGSTDDITIGGLPVQLTTSTSSAAAFLSNCGIQGGDAQPILNSNSLVSPQTTSGNPQVITFTFDQPLVLKKGATKTLQLQCDVSADAKGSFAWGVPSKNAGTLTATDPLTGTTTVATNFQNSGTSIPVKLPPSTPISAAATGDRETSVVAGVPNHPISSFSVENNGEPIVVRGAIFHINFVPGTASGPGDTDMPLGLTLSAQNGLVVAGPVDATIGKAESLAVFNDSITIPTGKSIFILKGQVRSTAVNGQKFVVRFTPATDWTDATGLTSGKKPSLSTAKVELPPVVVTNSSLSVSLQSTPPRTLVPGIFQATFANVVVDATKSGEDLRFGDLGFVLSLREGSRPTDLTRCRLLDGETALNNNSPLNPSDKDVQRVFFDSPLVVTKGTLKILFLQCNVGQNPIGSYAFGLSTTIPTITSVTGVTSGSAVVPVVTAGFTSPVTVQTSALKVSLDASSPSASMVVAGTRQIVTVLKIRATGEPINLNRLGLKLASGSAADIDHVEVLDGSTIVGTATFFGGNRTGTSTLVTPVLIPKDTDKTLNLAVVFSNIGTSQPAVAGDVVALGTTDDGTTTGTGLLSGTVVTGTGAVVGSPVRLMKSVPIVSLDTLPTSGLSDGRLVRIKITATANGPVNIAKLAFRIAGSISTATQLNAFAYSDGSYSVPAVGTNSGGALAASATNPVNGLITINASAPLQIPAGQTRFIELRGTLTGVTPTSSVTTTVLGDTTTSGLNGLQTASSAGINSNFVWSPNSVFSSSVFTDADWTNGVLVPGLPSSGITFTRAN